MIEALEYLVREINKDASGKYVLGWNGNNICTYDAEKVLEKAKGEK